MNDTKMTLIKMLKYLYHEIYHRGKYELESTPKSHWTLMTIMADEGEDIINDVKNNYPDLWKVIDDGSA